MKIPFRLISSCAILLWCCACRGPHIASSPQADAIPAELQPDTLHAAPQTASDSLDKPAPTDSTDFCATPGKDIASALLELVNDPLFERTQLGLYVYDLTDDRPLFSRGYQQRLRPASTMKLVTAITALDCLGTDYRLTTTLYADDTPTQDSVLRGHLYVRAGFDPLLAGEDLQAFVDSLTQQGVRSIRGDLILDLHCKDRLPAGWGWCWDDKNPPLTPLLIDGRDRFAEEFTALLRQSGIDFSGQAREGSVGKSAREICRRTHSMDQVLLPMLKESDNLMAESLFYQIAAHRKPTGAGRREAAAVEGDLLARLGLPATDYQVADGSGLSLYNYLTPECLVLLLRHAYRTPAIYRHLLPALPVAASDGTLRKRMHGTPAAENVRAKTGTVEGVSTLAGYATTAEGHLLAFAIMNQGQARNATARHFQDRVCEALTRPY